MGVDHDGYPPVMGYWGPLLSGALPEARLRHNVDRQMALKTPMELQLIRESYRWGHRAHELLQQYTHPGLTETEVSDHATTEATVEMTRTLAPHTGAETP